MPKIRVGFSFLLFNAIIFLFRESRLILGFYAACIIHEAGHIAAVRACGGAVRSVSLSCFGIKMTADPPRSTISGIIVLLSGPAANLLTAFILHICGISGYFAVFSLAEGLFNLLPYSFLDGGAALDMLAEDAENGSFFRNIITFLRIAVTFIILSAIIKKVYFNTFLY